MSNKLNRIVEGWSQYFKGEKVDPKIMEMAERRAAICIACPNFVHSEAYSIIDRIANIFTTTTKLEKTSVTGHTCSLCHCSYPAKLLVPDEHCPDNIPRWEAEKIETT